MTDQNRTGTASEEEFAIAWVAQESDIPGSGILDGGYASNRCMRISNDLAADELRQVDK